MRARARLDPEIDEDSTTSVRLTHRQWFEVVDALLYTSAFSYLTVEDGLARAIARQASIAIAKPEEDAQ
jgi:hypothetical protein